MVWNDRSAAWKFSAVALPVSLFLYLYSLTMYVVEVQKKIQILALSQTNTEAFRLFSTIERLVRDGDIFLAVIITLFTFFFPIAKYGALAYVLTGHSDRVRGRVLSWIKNLGQWSMGDVFVVALLVVLLRINSSVAQVHVVPRPGLYVFAASVLSAMVISAVLGLDWDARRFRRDGVRAVPERLAPPAASG